MREHSTEPESCARFDEAMRLFSRRWTGGIVRVLLDGPMRFTDIKQAVGVTDRMLSLRLSELEAEDLVERSVSADRPVRVTYALTAAGRGLDGVINAIEEWAHTWR